MRCNDQIRRRNEHIRKRYWQLSAKTVGGKRLYTYEAILHMLMEEFYLKTDTISRIIVGEKKSVDSPPLRRTGS